jgi:hypothetical protein
MVNSFLKKSLLQTTIIASVMVFILLNAFVPLDFSAQAEAIEYPFKLTTTLEKTTYKLREPVNITLCLENIGNENITLQFAIDREDFIVYDENFIQVYRLDEDRGYVTVYLPPHIMKPGETSNFTLTWYQSTGWETSGTIGTPDFEIIYHWAKPGTYYITGVFISGTNNVTLQTPPIRITIT